MLMTPSSSPAFGPVDSSPPSSPDLVPLDPVPSFSHPFAASAKTTRRLPSYEKKPCASVGVCRGPPLHEDVRLTAPFFPHRASRYVDREERIWDDALRQPFDTGIGQIDLSNQQLTSIPPSIGDLFGFFNTPESSEQSQSRFPTRALARINTDIGRTRSFERTQSIKDSAKDRHVLKLYLMGNMISSLPLELFTVRNLTVLSLRGNRLTCIPPDICHLSNLNELNISNNQLAFLPWQMRDMKIQKLLVNPNPFIPEPHSHPLLLCRPINRSYSLCKDALAGAIKPVLSPVTHTLPRLPPLAELCLRLLLAPSESSSSQQSVLAEYYGIPLSEKWSIPPNIRRTLMDTIPGILRLHKRFSIDPIPPSDSPSSGSCPSPVHRGRVFVRHASERFSWERQIAGVYVGGSVPLRWRGCMQTCLDFLDEHVTMPATTMGTPSTREDNVDVDISDVNMDVAVRAVDLGQGDLDMDDFDD